MLMKLDPDEWIEFFSEYIADHDVADVITEACSLQLGDDGFNARRIMLQTKRLVEISKAQSDVTINNDALKLMFLIILAENAAKLFFEFEGNGQSKAHVKKFFNDMATEGQRNFLNESITVGITPQGIDFASTFLYKVRCDVAHEGIYYLFDFCEDIPLITNAGDQCCHVTLQYNDFVSLVVNIAYNAIKSKLGI